MEETKPTEQQGEGKIKKRFEASMKKVQALLKDPNWFKAEKIGKDDLPNILQELAADEKLEIFNRFKAAYKSLVDKKRAYDKAIKQKEQEFNKAVEDKMKEFLVDLDAMLSMVDQMDSIEKEYYVTLHSIQEGTPPATVGGLPSEDDQVIG